MEAEVIKGLKKSSIDGSQPLDIGLVFSGGGSRAAYQVGALKALIPYLLKKSNNISVVVGSSIGAINSLIIGATYKGDISYSVELLESLWRERTYRNSFEGSPSKAFIKAIQVGFIQYFSQRPGPNATNRSIFNPSPLEKRVDEVIDAHGGLSLSARSSLIKSVAVMTTLEGPERKPLLIASSTNKLNEEELAGASFDILYMDRLHAKHGLASAALPSVLPPVELNLETHTVKLVDGGICDNIPVDPAARLGARDILIFDASGRKWWCDVYNEPYYSKSSWEVLSKTSTFCHCPPRLTEFRNTIGLGTILKETVGKSTKSFIQALGPTWPIFRLLKHSMGETLAYEVMSYAALHHDYIDALLEQGYNDAKEIIAKQELHFNGFSDDHGIAA